MKKYLCFIFIILLFFFKSVKAEDLNLEEEIISFDKINNFSLQGFTTANKYLFMVLVESDDLSSIIQVYDLDTYELVKSYAYKSLGHANDVTYNKNTNKLYILRADGSSLVEVFDGNNWQHEKTIDVKLPIRSITYVDSEDQYYVRTVATGFRLDNKLNWNNKIPFIIGMNFNNDIGRQGWEYYNGFIYYTNWSWIRLGGDGSNIIYVYDLKGNMRQYLHTKEDIGEVEGIAFYNNKMILGFNGYDKKIKFYISDIPSVPEMEPSKEDDEIKEESKSYKIYYIGGLIVIFIIIWKVKNKMCK